KRAEPTIVCGDMNIAPTDDDVFDPDAYVGQTHVTPPEREALGRLQAVGLRDIVRERWPNERVFTNWDYRAGMFHQDCGMRIDLADPREAGRHRRDHEVLGLHPVELVPRQWRRHWGAGLRADAGGGGDRPVARVLVVIDEDALAAFLLPPSGRDLPEG